MSRIGVKPITVPAGVEITISADQVTTKGPKATLTSPLFDGISVAQEGNVLTVSCADVSNLKMKGNFGMVRALLANNIVGVSSGFEVVLELRGVGYRAQVQGNTIDLSLGFSHPVKYAVPEGVEAKVDQSRIMLTGADKQRVGQVAAEIRAIRPPEPYKGKGVRYVDERVIMKEGKKA
ncbi:MAG: 50S ribosomal protein L6 [Mariprofundaceae bacterium]